MVDLHSMFRLGLGDHAHNYLIHPVTDRQRWHAFGAFTAMADATAYLPPPDVQPGEVVAPVTRTLPKESTALSVTS